MVNTSLSGKLSTNGYFKGPLSSLNSKLNLSLENQQLNANYENGIFLASELL